MKNVMFDLYGTLIDIHTEESLDSFWENFANETKGFKAYKPNRLRDKYLKLCKKYQKKVEEINILDVFIEIFDVNMTDALMIARTFRRLSTIYIKLYDGVVELLDKLNNDGYHLFVLSNAQNAFTVPELHTLGIYDKFDDIAISSDYGFKKPNEKFYVDAMNHFSIDSADTVMVGNDYECDIAPARKLGLKTVFIESNLTPEHKENDYVAGFDFETVYNKIVEALK